MIDIKLLREKPDFVKQKTLEKGYKIDIDKILNLDTARRDSQTTIESLQQRRNEIAAKAKGGKKPSNEDIKLGKEIKEMIARAEAELKKCEEVFMPLFKSVPNITSDDVPVGDESKFKIVGEFGDRKKGGIDHLDLAIKKSWVDFEGGAKVAGNKFYYLKGDLALLENAILQFSLDYVLQKDFNYMIVPHMVNSDVATGAGFAPRTSEQSDEYFIENEDLTLIATAEIPLTGYHKNDILDEADLPIKYTGYSPCYRKEAGTYGKHTRGLFRVHQFNKLEMYAFTLPEKSAEMHEVIRQTEEGVWQAIGIPYRVINIASGDLGAAAAKKYDIEYWSPVDETYRELTSCSNCTDYQTRNLNIKVRRKDGTIELAHSLNGTVAAMARTLVAIMDNFQDGGGNVSVPKVLQKYMGGREAI
jgi:seryl-tRNA synthetase